MTLPHIQSWPSLETAAEECRPADTERTPWGNLSTSSGVPQAAPICLLPSALSHLQQPWLFICHPCLCQINVWQVAWLATELELGSPHCYLDCAEQAIDIEATSSSLQKLYILVTQAAQNYSTDSLHAYMRAYILVTGHDTPA